MISNLRSSPAARVARALALVATPLALAALAACSDSTAPDNSGTTDEQWDPSQDQIFFVSDRVALTDGTGGTDIFRMNADGTGAVNVSNGPTYEGYADNPWSPDGTKIAFRRSGVLYVVNADGTGLANVTTASAEESGWSPDGAKLLFVGATTGDNEIYVTNANGTGVTNLSKDPAANDQRAIWVPKK